MRCIPRSRTEDKVKVDMEGEGDGLEDEDVEEEEDAVGQDWPGHGPLGWGRVWVTLSNVIVRFPDTGNF